MNKLKIAIALFLMLSFAVSLFAVLPAANAAVISKPDRPTGAYLSTNPDLIGINQELTVNLWIYPSPTGPNYEMGTNMPYLGTGGMHFWNVSVTFTRPDGSKDTFMPTDGSTWFTRVVGGVEYKTYFEPGETEEVGTMWFYYKPNQIGDWTVQMSFPGNTFTVLNYSVYYKPSTSQTVTFTVQEDPVQVTKPVPLPTGYWERPISAENREWYQIAGDWLVGGNTVNQYATAPNSPHILWKTTIGIPGGLIGGEWGSWPYYTAGVAPRIWNGRVYYSTNTMDGTSIFCRDLRSGELVWKRLGSLGTMNIQTQGLYEFAGSAAAYIWEYSATTGWKQYDAWTGQLSRTITTNIPNLGTPQWLDNNVAYLLRQGTWDPNTLRRPYNYLIKWDMSKVTGNNWLTGVVWNVSMKQPDGTGPGEGSRGSSGPALLADLGLAVVYTTGEGHFYAYDLATGAQRWVHDLGIMCMSHYWTPEGKLVEYDSSDMTLHYYDVGTWKELWSTQVGEYPWGSQLTDRFEAYGNVYIDAYDGYVKCIDSATGNIEWKYYFGNTTETPYGSWAARSIAAADGKIYVGNSEHTPSLPLTKGNRLTCIDASTGEGIWNITSSINADFGIAEGYLIASDEYTGYTYCFGKGKTATTVSAPLTAITLGQSLTVQGTVMDASPASAGTAAISDEDMSGWMEYLHMQKEIPMNAKGVEVSLDAVDPNNNFIHIATVTSDSSGLFKKMFKPEVPGEYTVIATFAGSESYWASYAETAVGVVEASAVTPSAETIVPDNMPIYAAVIGVGIAIIIAIAIAVVLILRKKP